MNKYTSTFIKQEYIYVYTYISVNICTCKVEDRNWNLFDLLLVGVLFVSLTS